MYYLKNGYCFACGKFEFWLFCGAFREKKLRKNRLFVEKVGLAGDKVRLILLDWGEKWVDVGRKFCECGGAVGVAVGKSMCLRVLRGRKTVEREAVLCAEILLKTILRGKLRKIGIF